MKQIITLTILLLTLVQFNIYGQETYGKTLNLGIGLGGHYGYYSYVGNSLPVLHLDYEFDVAKNFSLAPTLNIHHYSKSYLWKNKNYSYSETGLAVGIKGTYYFDQMLRANSKWDFYLASTIGFVALFSNWDNDYDGDKDYYRKPNPLILDLHMGAEYHLNNRLGLFLDLSTGTTMFGIAIH